MQANVGGVDKVIRIVVAVVIIGLGIAYKSWWGAVGIIPLATALLKCCPAYLPFGINTCGRAKKE